MKIKLEIELPFPRENDQVGGGPRNAADLDPLVIIGQGSLATLYCPDPYNPGRIIRRRPDGTTIDRSA